MQKKGNNALFYKTPTSIVPLKIKSHTDSNEFGIHFGVES